MSEGGREGGREGVSVRAYVNWKSWTYGSLHNSLCLCERPSVDVD